VALARAVACKPKLLLADEPTANLDEEAASQALALLREVAGEVSASLVLVTHDRTVAAQFARQLVLGTHRERAA
jgi:putative ABC transport system ATP-binding protein